jgi:hypothetical protein
MNVYAVIVILLVIAMVVGPVSMMQPNRSQRRREQLRRRAREMGLTVSLLPPPPLATDTEPPAAMPVYSLITSSAQPCWSVRRTEYAHESHLNQWWQFVGATPPEPLLSRIQNTLKDLPSGVLALRMSSRQIEAFWRESGDEQAVAQLLECLRELSA